MSELLDNLRWCSQCLAMSTRPRISFDDQGLCNACIWAKKKQSLDWVNRESKLEKLLGAHRRSDGRFDCVVPVSGGKDGSYVAHTLKSKWGMNPLSVTIKPPLPTELGEDNLQAFIASGFPHIAISPDPEAMRTLNKRGLIDMGFPYYGWLVAITAAPVEIAARFGIDLLFYGEDGEVEYGGSTETDTDPEIRVEYMKRVYLEAGYEKVMTNAGLSAAQMQFFSFPDDDLLARGALKRFNWSYFENWDPYRNYLVAKEFCGLKEGEQSNAGTFTNFAQNDQFLYALHTYLMYVKFGFGRANQDGSIEIRRGAMDRDQAVELVRIYDGQYPEEFEQLYLDYFEMTADDFHNILNLWTNTELFEISGYSRNARFRIS
jgi:N-acetyl sugar amidotransferase